MVGKFVMVAMLFLSRKHSWKEEWRVGPWSSFRMEGSY